MVWMSGRRVVLMERWKRWRGNLFWRHTKVGKIGIILVSRYNVCFRFRNQNKWERRLFRRRCFILTTRAADSSEKPQGKKKRNWNKTQLLSRNLTELMIKIFKGENKKNVTIKPPGSDLTPDKDEEGCRLLRPNKFRITILSTRVDRWDFFMSDTDY